MHSYFTPNHAQKRKINKNHKPGILYRNKKRYFASISNFSLNSAKELKLFESFIKCDNLWISLDDHSSEKKVLSLILIMELREKLIERKWLDDNIFFSCHFPPGINNFLQDGVCPFKDTGQVFFFSMFPLKKVGHLGIWSCSSCKSFYLITLLWSKSILSTWFSIPGLLKVSISFILRPPSS